jgi:hypothetical protein
MSFSLALALCCASAYAATPGVAIDTPDVQIGDWEQSMDGWGSWLGTDSYSSTVGVTSGSYSLRHDKGALGWNTILGVAVDPDAFFGNSQFSIDASILGSEWGQHWHELQLIVNSEAGCHQEDTLMPLQAVNETPTTYTWDYSWLDGVIMASPGWLELVIVGNDGLWGTDIDPPATGVYYFDNAWLSGGPIAPEIPEPTTIALLGLGGVALLRKRR